MNAWPWKRTSYRTETHGDYAVVATPDGEGWMFLAWQGKGTSANFIGGFTAAADAKQACAAHNEGKQA